MFSSFCCSLFDCTTCKTAMWIIEQDGAQLCIFSQFVIFIDDVCYLYPSIVILYANRSCTIGRGPDCVISIKSDKSISRLQAEISLQAPNWSVHLAFVSPFLVLCFLFYLSSFFLCTTDRFYKYCLQSTPSVCAG